MIDDSVIVGLSDDVLSRLLHPGIDEVLGGHGVVQEHIDGDVRVQRYRYPLGVLEFSRDYNSVQVEARDAQDREIVRFKLRDRRFDGTPKAQSPLTDWPYDGECDKVEVPALELSRYSRDPRRYHPDAELADFLREPFDYIFDDPDRFVGLWKRAFVSAHFPGQSALPLRGAARFFAERSKQLAGALGFAVTVSPSHYYVARSDERNGYVFQSSAQKRELDELEGLFGGYALYQGIARQQKSWILLLQKFPSLRESELAGFYLEGLEYPLYYDGEHTENVWMIHGSKEGFKDYAPVKCLERLEAYGRARAER